MESFEEFLIEAQHELFDIKSDDVAKLYEMNFGEERDFEKSPFLKFPEFQMKTRRGHKKPGDLNRMGELMTFIYNNPGLSARELWASVLGRPSDSTQAEMYRSGGHQVDNIVSAAIRTGYLKVSKERPQRYFAVLDKNTTVEEAKEKSRGKIQGRKFGI